MPTITEKYEEEVRKQKEDAEAIRTATDYYGNSYLKHGSACDSSDRSQHRMKYVQKAEKQLEEKHKKEVLELASKLCLEDI